MIEKVLCAAIQEAHGRQVEEALDGRSPLSGTGGIVRTSSLPVTPFARRSPCRAVSQGEVDLCLGVGCTLGRFPARAPLQLPTDLVSTLRRGDESPPASPCFGQHAPPTWVFLNMVQ
jgi:hypothetical protein